MTNLHYKLIARGFKQTKPNHWFQKQNKWIRVTVDKKHITRKVEAEGKNWSAGLTHRFTYKQNELRVENHKVICQVSSTCHFSQVHQTIGHPYIEFNGIYVKQVL
jgi:hypothetical protein